MQAMVLMHQALFLQRCSAKSTGTTLPLPCFWLLNSFSSVWRSDVFPTHSTCSVSRCLLNLFGFMLSAHKIFMQSKHSGLCFPSTSISARQVFYISFSAFMYFYIKFIYFKQLHCLYSIQVHYLSFPVVTTQIFIYRVIACHTFWKPLRYRIN